VLCAGADDSGARAVVVGPAGTQLVGLDDASPASPVDLGPDNAPLPQCVLVDLDGDRRDEVYLTGRRALVIAGRDPDGRWQVRDQELGSEPWDLVGGDLDGDGAAELVLSVGEWRAYDVRLYRAAHGALALVDRLRLGVVTDLAALGGGRIVALEWPGEPRYVVRNLMPCDLDADGRIGLLASRCDDHDRCDLAVMVDDGAGDFGFRAIAGVEPLAVLDADGDDADELVAHVDGGGALWLLGAGDTPVPPREFPTVTAEAPDPAAQRDPAVAAAWSRAEDLAAIGLIDEAAEALRRIAALGAGDVERAALRRAAAMLRTRGRFAAALSEEIARLEPAGSPARIDAWRAAVEDYLAEADLEPARRVIAQLLDDPALPAAERSRLEALRAQLVAAPLPLFDGELGPAWRVRDPALVHVAPGSRRLSVETLTPGPVATVPLVRGDGPLGVIVEGEVTRTEWAGSLRIRIGPRDPTAEGAITFEVGGRGGGGIYHRVHSCGRGIDRLDRAAPLPEADHVEAIRVEITLLPARGIARCQVTIDGVTEHAVVPLPVATDRAWELSLEGGGDSSVTSATARLAAVSASGFTVDPAPPSPLDDAARALAGHQPAEALAVLDRQGRAAQASWPARRLRAIALDETGDPAAAVALLEGEVRAAATVPSILRDLAVLCRARDEELAPMIRAAFGADVARVLDEAWRQAATHDLDEPRIRAAVMRELDDLPAATAATREPTALLLSYRGEALIGAGRLDEARRVLAAALELAGDPPAPTVRDRAEAAARLLAIDAAARGDLPAAHRWGQRSIEVASHPELAADMLLLDPTLRDVTGPDAAYLRAEGRELLLGK
jgi:hypothetical protein